VLPRLAVAVAVAATVTGLLRVVRGSLVPDARADPPVAGPSTVPVERWPEPPALRAVRVLEEWQQARSRAYTSGDPGALRRLYVPRSPAGRRDVRLLRAYAARGLRLDLATETDRLAVLVAHPDRVVVRRHALTRAVVLRSGRRHLLPARWAWRTVELQALGGRWRLRSARVPSGSPRVPP
jgi:hypothetical protein